MPRPVVLRSAVLALLLAAAAAVGASCGSAEGAAGPAAERPGEAPGPAGPVTTPVPPTTGPTGPTSTFPPSSVGVAYGPLPAQLLDVHRATAPSRGTIVFFHAGGWVDGSRSSVMASILAQTAAGFDVVSVDHRVAPEVRADGLLADADRAVRTVRARADDLGVHADPLIVAGGSAGGLVAAMLATAPGASVDPSLPADLASTSPLVDGLIDVAGPSDLAALGTSAGWGPTSTAQLLGCSLAGDLGPGLPTTACPAGAAERFSPLARARRAATTGTALPPAYLVFGPADALVSVEVHGRPLLEAWSSAPGSGPSVLDAPAGAGHNLDDVLDRAALGAWLDEVVARAG